MAQGGGVGTITLAVSKQSGIRRTVWNNYRFSEDSDWEKYWLSEPIEDIGNSEETEILVKMYQTTRDHIAKDNIFIITAVTISNLTQRNDKLEVLLRKNGL
jgi:hypothetical protein